MPTSGAVKPGFTYHIGYNPARNTITVNVWRFDPYISITAEVDVLATGYAIEAKIDDLVAALELLM